MKKRAINLLVPLAILLLSQYTLATEIKPKREIILENEQVQVVRLTYPTGTESGMHTHAYPHRVVYFVKGGKLMLVPKDSSKASKTLIAVDGQTLFLPVTTHNVKNIGNNEVVIVETELK